MGKAATAEKKAPAISKRLEAKVSGIALLFIWTRTSAVEVPTGEAVDIMGSLRQGIRVVSSVAAQTRKQDGWGDRLFTVAFRSPDELLMLWSVLAPAKGGAEIDASYAARNALRSLHQRVIDAKGANGNGS